MNFNFTKYILSFLFVFSVIFGTAQTYFSDFSKEKTYIHTNHVFYKPGEDMYYKIYIVNAENNLPTDLSKAVNVELIEPSGTVSRKEKLEIKNGFAEGFFHFSEDMKGGIYKIRAYTNWMQNEKGKNVFEKEITLQKIVSPRILMKLDFPKKGYGAGDEVFADFSMRSLANLPIPFYEADFTVLHQGEKVSEGKLITDKEGKYLIRFKLPEVLKSADALLTVKVDFDGFTESISRNIPVVLNNLDLKFMPEGGTFINGIEQNIAFKITDEFEKPVDAILHIFNQNHQKVLEVSAYNFGMGSFAFTPKKGESYYAKVIKPENINAVFQLPMAQDEGFVFNIKKENQNVQLILKSSSSRTFKIEGSFRGKNIYSKSLVLKDGLNIFEIPEKDLPVGICRFTIVENTLPLAERIVFTNEHRQLSVKMTPVKQHYLPRKKVVVNIETLDENQKPIPANLSVSVIDDKLWTYADDKQNHILSWLLMDSELRGKVERPQFYFDKKEAKAAKSLDLLMLTNGYRYFEMIPEVEKTKKYKFLPEQKNPIYGIVEDENKKPVKAEIYLIEGNHKILQQTTSDNGLFYFSDLKRDYQNKLIAKSLEPKKNVKIRLLAYKLNVNPLQKQNLTNIDVEEIIREAEIKEKPETDAQNTRNENFSKNLQKTYSKSDTVRSSNIEEVVTIGYAVTKTNLTSSVKTVVNDEVSNVNTISAIAGKVSSVQVTSAAGNPGAAITIRGSVSSSSSTTALVVIDGVISDVKDLSTINPKDIQSVSVLKDAAATALYGSRGANGVILVNFQKNSRANIKFDLTPKTYYDVLHIPNDSLQSYPYQRQFAYPVYKSTNTAFRHDYRETIYWNPVVETDKNGKAVIEFYNSDANTTFRMISEGISAKGLIGREEKTYAAQSLISIDAKLPQYLTRTDKMKIPVVIKNNSSETRTMTMDVMVPNYVRLMKADTVLVLKPLESGRLFAEIQTDELTNSNIQFSVKSGDFRETMILPMKVEEKGFPHRFSIINNQSENIKINIPETINGTMISSYYVYENSALQMFEDIERLKNEPHGCFEQLSSTVYPNIFVLDYLKSVKKITPQTEYQVIRNLKKGYQKMIAYKKQNGGFAYFGDSDADVALSAFALLEFTDLKKYVKVDQKLLQKLSDFILSKKNGNGLFDVKRSYEKTASFSDYSWSRNMYVLFALSKLGYGPQLQDSYEVSLKRALATKDSYQLALMANTSFYLNKKSDHQIILNLLNEQFEEKNIKAKTTFTGSGGMSASAETLSLYMMALQKDEKVNQVQIAKVADKLIYYNGYYGFGSTQATSLALEALASFFAKNEKLYGTEKPKIKINGAEVKADQSISSAYRTGDNEIAVEYSTKKGLPYKLDYHYYTLKAPESKNVLLTLDTKLKSELSKVGETNRMTVTVKNKINSQLPMTTAKIGIPAGLTLQNALLKDMLDKKLVSYYEIFDNYLVLYWEHLDANETKVINLDLKVEFAGEYTGKASNVYLYYMPEAKFWNEGIKAKINP